MECLRYGDVRDVPSLKERLSQVEFEQLLVVIAKFVLPRGLHVVSDLLQKKDQRLSLGNSFLDTFFQGGLLVEGALNEISGASGTGKTQLALQLCLTVQLPLNNGGLDGGKAKRQRIFNLVMFLFSFLKNALLLLF